MLKEQIQKEINDALKSGNQLKRLVLGMLITAIKNKELIKRGQLSKTISDQDDLQKQSQLEDQEVIEVVASEIKKRKEAIGQFQAGNRPELAQKEKNEMDILLSYLPVQLSESEVKSEIEKIVKETGASNIKDMGKVIGLVMTKLKGKADGSAVSRIVKELLTT